MNAEDEIDEIRKFLRQEYPNHIANEYSNLKELSLAKFDGHDMVCFAEAYHQHKLSEIRKQMGSIPSKYLCVDDYNEDFENFIPKRSVLTLIDNQTK